VAGFERHPYPAHSQNGLDRYFALRQCSGSFIAAVLAMSEQSELNGKFLFFTYRLMVSNIIFFVNHFSNIIHNDTA